MPLNKILDNVIDSIQESYLASPSIFMFCLMQSFVYFNRFFWTVFTNLLKERQRELETERQRDISFQGFASVRGNGNFNAACPSGRKVLSCSVMGTASQAEMWLASYLSFYLSFFLCLLSFLDKSWQISIRLD